MIPVRVYLEGFLCYRRAQEACFEGCSLWLLAGANGSGKSAIFDAVTWVLFGQHRGGRHHARGLINWQSDGLLVEFDFRLDEDLYRARRTLSRSGRATRQMYQQSAATADGDHSWCALPGTDSERGFGSWIEEHLGLTYETFTASVLLLQGRAEKLLQAFPAQRHQLLSQVVGLDRFERLHELAKQHRSSARGSAAQLRRQLGRTANISAQQLAQARRAVDAAEGEHRRAAVEVDRLAAALGQARHSQQLDQQHTALAKRREALQSRIRDSAPLGARLERRELLARHLPDLWGLVRDLDATSQCRGRLERLEQQHAALSKRARTLAQAHEASERMLRDAQQRLEFSAARREAGHRELAALTVALAATERRCAARDQLRRLRRDRRRAQRQIEQAICRRGRLLQDMARIADLPAARQQVLDGGQRVGRLEAVLLNAQESLQRLDSVADRDVCPYCRQALPPSHLQRERRRLDKEFRYAERDHQEARQRLVVARDRTSQLEARHSQLVELLQVTDRQASQWEATMSAVRSTADAAVREYRKARNQLLAVVRDLPPAVLGCRGSAAAGMRLSLNAIRASQQRLEAELQKRHDEMVNDRRTLVRTRSELQRLAADQAALNEETQSVLEVLATARGVAAHHRDRCAERRARLPAAWQDWSDDTITERAAQLAHEEQELSSGGCLRDAAQLAQLRSELQEVEVRMAALQEQLDSEPGDLSRDPDELQLRLETARRQCESRQTEWQTAMVEQQRFEEAAQRRKAAGEELKQADRIQYLWGRLVELLGRDGLQRFLLLQAEQVIVDYANAILDRLGGEGLYLELRCPEQRGYKALDLLARSEATAGQPQDVAFLSGSQKFRVAVSLSLAIGQYASRTRRPVQAVIIDEGFGCLDTVNRQVMIQELQNLQGQLQRILLVSHQDEFFNAFPDGYRCELIDGTTRLTPFHR